MCGSIYLTFLKYHWSTHYGLPEVKEGVEWEGKVGGGGWKKTRREILGSGGNGLPLDSNEIKILAVTSDYGFVRCYRHWGKWRQGHMGPQGHSVLFLTTACKSTIVLK